MFKTNRNLRFVAVLLALLLCLPLCFGTVSAAETASGTCGENLTWTYDATTRTLTISGEGRMDGYGWSASPWDSYEDQVQTVVIGKGVVRIGAYAFYDFDNLKTVTFEKNSGLLQIGASAFAAI